MSLVRFGHLGGRLFNRPLMVYPPKAEVILGVVAERMGITSIIRLNGEVVAPHVMAFDQEDENESRTDRIARRGYDVIEGVARIEITGTLVQKLGTLRPFSNMTGYDGIAENFFAAMVDPAVRGIMLDIDSPGGEVAGAFDLADAMVAQRSRKPIWACLSENALSAGYLLASTARHITVPRTGNSGSIGIVWMHCDLNQALDKAGVKVTFIKRGKNKVDGAAELPLSEEAFARFQLEIDTVGELFESTVAANRGLSSDKIRDMNALTFLGQEGVRQGLVDDVMSPAESFKAFVESLD